MKMFALAAAAVAAIAIATPASAQIAVDTPVGGVRIGASHRDRHHHNHRAYRVEREAYASCRTVKTRTVTPSGKVIIERKQYCR